MHLPRDDCIHFIQLQQWLATHLGMTVPLLDGMFVLVPSAQLQQQQQHQGADGLPDFGVGGRSDSSRLAAAVPWRLRQVSRVEVAPGGDPAEATVVLVGGDRVRAGAVREGQLEEVPDHEVRAR